MTPAEVASLFGVDPKTVARWATANKVSCIRTLGGHRRYRRADIDRLLEQRERREAYERRFKSGTQGRGW